MMSRWFRMYDEILDDPKVQKLSPELYRTWVNSLALCSRNGGKLPSIADCSFAFRETEESVSSAFHALLADGLFVTVDETFQPKNWNKRQYKSDTSTDRVKRFRKRSRNGDETAPDTDTETETETETEKKEEGGGKPPTSSYAFFGQTIRLTPRHLGEWKRTYSNIFDLEAELRTIDAWWQTQPEAERKQWFHRTMGMLNRKHQEIGQSKKRDDGYDPNVITV